MWIQCDDELYRVDRVYLGPRGKPWPMRSTYKAWGYSAGFLVVYAVLWRMFGLPWNLLVLTAIATGGYWSAKWLDKKVTVDRPASCEAQRVVQELAAPRPDLDPREVTYSHQVHVRRWRAGAEPERRWWARAGAWLAVVPGRAAGRLTGRRDGRVYVDGGWRDVR